MSDDQISSQIARVREIASLLPRVEEQVLGGDKAFSVEQKAFAKVDDAGTLHVLTAVDDTTWTRIELNGDTDWALVEDAIARSWELSAPAGLLEAGGR